MVAHNLTRNSSIFYLTLIHSPISLETNGGFHGISIARTCLGLQKLVRLGLATSIGLRAETIRNPKMFIFVGSCSLASCECICMLLSDFRSWFFSAIFAAEWNAKKDFQQERLTDLLYGCYGRIHVLAAGDINCCFTLSTPRHQLHEAWTRTKQMPYNIIIADLATIGLQYWNYMYSWQIRYTPAIEHGSGKLPIYIPLVI